MNGQYNVGDVVLQNWTLTRLLGQGSFGKVFEAKRTDFAGEYYAAIKIIPVPQSESEIADAISEGMTEKSASEYFRNIVEDLAQEFVLMSELKGHSNIVSYEDHEVIAYENRIGWDIIIRMELLTPLTSILKEEDFTKEEIIRFGIDICKALEVCQKHSIIHRDIKPDNIFRTQDGAYKLGDFGVARTLERTTGGLSKKGTYNYMAPEVYRDENYGLAVDIYSLGIVLYRLMNFNRIPFLPPYPELIRMSDREDALARRMCGERLPVPAHDYGRLTDIVLKACAYDPKDRYLSPAEMRRDLEELDSKESPDEDQRRSPQEVYHTEEKAVSTGSVRNGNQTLSAKNIPENKKHKKRSVISTNFAGILILLLLVAGAGIIIFKRIYLQPAGSNVKGTESQSLDSTEKKTPEPQEEYIVDPDCQTVADPIYEEHAIQEPEGSEPIIKPDDTPEPIDYFLFGRYEQDNNPENGKEPIEWIVLAKEENRMLLISRYAIESQCYASNGANGGVTWENCTLRTWLNERFLNEAFDSEEQSRIIDTTVSADDNPEYSTYSGNVTRDKIFLLSGDEAEIFFDNNNKRECAGTERALSQGSYKSKETGQCYWWLRTTGSTSYHTAVVNTKGEINYFGIYALDDNGSVRPAMWVTTK